MTPRDFLPPPLARVLGVSPEVRRKRDSRAGFTLVEVAIVLVIIGLVLGFAISGWMALMEARKVTATQSLLKDAKRCLLKRALVSERYPSFTTNLTCGGGGDPSMDVDDCICAGAMEDSWGEGIRFLEGLRSLGLGLSGEPFVSEEVRGQERVEPDGLYSRILDHEGVVRDDVAFVLISYGEDRSPDNTSYGNLFSGGIRAAAIGGTMPDFQAGHVDDVYLVVTSYELASTVKD